MTKVVIKHYLNKRLKPHLIDNVLKHPVYVRVAYGRKNYRFASQWVNFRVSETEFEDDKEILETLDYEKRVILEIIEMAMYSESINIPSRLRTSFDSVSECFLVYCGRDKTFKDDIIDYLAKCADINKGIINHFVDLEYIDSEGWKELVQKGAFSDENKKQVLFLAMLLEYYEKQLNEEGCIFGFYEWRRQNGKSKFTAYASKLHLIDNKDVEQFCRELDQKLVEMVAIDYLG